MKIAQVMMALLLLVSTMGVTVNKHYCMGELRSVAIHRHAPNCFELVGQEGEMAMDCCEDTSDLYQVDDDQQKSNQHVELKPSLQLLATISYFLVDFSLNAQSEVDPDYLNYKPPLIAQDVPVLVQSFLL